MITRSLTNNADRVVKEIVPNGYLPEGRRLFYFDSEGALDEILVQDGRHAGFWAGPKARDTAPGLAEVL
jgi:hypothetical protein